MAWLNYTRALGPKQLVPIPWMVAMALQADGWILRSDIVWAKPAPMPESVTDRPTKAHEYVFLLSKSERYYYDADAIRENFADERMGNPGKASGNYSRGSGRNDSNAGKPWNEDGAHSGRNARSVWTIATQPYSGEHFAAFPEELAARCIKAGSAAQACGVCGAPWARVMERTAEFDTSAKGSTFDGGKTGARDGGERTQPGRRWHKMMAGFEPTCEHGDGSSSSVILDPFNGTGTTGRVALRLGRRYVGLDLSREYLREQALARVDPLAAAAQAARAGSAQQVMKL